jgi:hypothetical protein
VTGFCADGVCCSTRCSGACTSCALPGTMGACRPVSAGAPDPHSFCKDQGSASCGFNGTCDGNGGCQHYGSGTFCSEPKCVGASWTLPGNCNGQGTCFAPIVSCAPLVCRDDFPACQLLCGSQVCPAAAYCSTQNQCLPKRPPGAGCVSADECLSGRCTGADSAGVCLAPL